MNIVLGKKIDRYAGGLAVAGLLFGSRWWGRLTGFRRTREKEPTPGKSLLVREGESSADPVHRTVRTIVLLKFWGLGNIILIAPLVRAIRRRHSEARIVFVSFSSNQEILKRISEIDEVWILDLKSWIQFGLSFFRVWKKMVRAGADLVVDFEQFCYLSSVLCFCSGAKRTVGFQTEGSRRGQLYDQPIAYREDRHMIEIFAGLVGSQSVHVGPLSLRPVDYSPSEAMGAMRFLGLPFCRWVGMHPGSGDNFPGRRWSAERFAELADRLVEEFGVSVYFTGTGDEEDLVSRILGHMRNTGLNLCGRTSLGVLAALVDRSLLFVSNDTGPLHVAAAMGTPLVAFYGPNTPKLYGPVSSRSLVFYRDLPCSPCISNLNLKESSCRLPLCVQSIRVSDVVEEIEKSGWLEPIPTPNSGKAESATGEYSRTSDSWC